MSSPSVVYSTAQHSTVQPSLFFFPRKGAAPIAYLMGRESERSKTHVTIRESGVNREDPCGEGVADRRNTGQRVTYSITDRLRSSTCHCLFNRILHLLGRCRIPRIMRATSGNASGEDSAASGLCLAVCL